MGQNAIVLGAVAYDPKVVTIWDGFQIYFGRRGLDFDYILYTTYERQVEALAGRPHRCGMELAAGLAAGRAHRSQARAAGGGDLHARHGPRSRLGDREPRGRTREKRRAICGAAVWPWGRRTRHRRP